MAAVKKKIRRKKTTKKITGSRAGWIRWITSLILACVMLLSAFLFSVWKGAFGPLPGQETLRSIENNTATEVFSSDGKLMGRYFIENRLTINNKDISPHVLNALIATEDKRYFEHEGVDYRSLGRVILKSMLLGKRSQGGGSTISQQLARNLYPREGRGWVNLIINKTKEAFIAMRLEQVYTKEQILNLYLNTVPFGENLFGVETASQRFFGKNSASLKPNEAATLVGMLAANTAYNPRLHPERSIQRRNVVLKRMQEQGYLDETETLEWVTSPLDLQYRRIDKNTGIAPYFRDRIEYQALEVLRLQYQDSINLYTDGLRIYTTIDSRLQEHAERSGIRQMALLQDEFDQHWAGKEPWENNPDFLVEIIKQSKRYKSLKEPGMKENQIFEALHQPENMFLPGESGPRSLSPVDSIRQSLRTLHMGFLALEPKTGKILVWIGGINHEYYQYDHVISKRQVGSTFKPFVYAAALKNGMKPCEFISNEQRIYEEYDGWSPANSDGNHEGYYSIKGGLTHSVNTISAELIMRIGPEAVLELTRSMGLDENIPALPSIALGTAELSLLEMVAAYSTFPGKGSYTEPWGLERIEDHKGNILYKREPSAPVLTSLDKETNMLMIELLRNVVDSGTAKSLRTTFHINGAIAGKTGTTQNNGDGWFIGFTPALVAGAWVGAEYPTIHFRTTNLGQGAHTALPIAGRFFKYVEQDPFRSGYISGSFELLPIHLAKQLECPDYVLENPEFNFFERLFSQNPLRDSLRLKQKAERRAKREAYKKELDKQGVTGIKKTFRLLFRKKDKTEAPDTLGK